MERRIKLNVLIVVVILISAMTFASGGIRLNENYPGGGGPVNWVEKINMHKSLTVAVGVNFNLWVTIYIEHHFNEDGTENSYIINASQSVGLTGTGLDVSLSNAGSSHFIFNNEHNITINGYGTVRISANIGGQEVVNFKRVSLTINYSSF